MNLSKKSYKEFLEASYGRLICLRDKTSNRFDPYLVEQYKLEVMIIQTLMGISKELGIKEDEAC